MGYSAQNNDAVDWSPLTQEKRGLGPEPEPRVKLTVYHITEV